MRRGGSAQLLNAYPPRYFEAILSRRRLYSSIPLAAALAGLPLMTADDLQSGRALAADFTGIGWAAQPDFPPAPIYEPEQAGEQMARLSLNADLTWFDYWPSDYAGHRASLAQAVSLLETFDRVLGGLVQAWSNRPDLVVLTSDHGNLEDLAHRGHTLAPVPGLLIGPRACAPRLRPQPHRPDRVPRRHPAHALRVASRRACSFETPPPSGAIRPRAVTGRHCYTCRRRSGEGRGRDRASRMTA